MRTTFIGSLSAIEKFFSELWEYDYQDGEEVSKRKRVWKEKWEQCRAEILNNGNNQLRAVDAEIDQ